MCRFSPMVYNSGNLILLVYANIFFFLHFEERFYFLKMVHALIKTLGNKLLKKKKTDHPKFTIQK